MRKPFFFIGLFLLFKTGVNGEDLFKVLPMDEFVQTAAKTDTEFEQILIEELYLKYQKALTLPANDLVISLKQQYDFFLDRSREEPNTTVNLSKLFPFTGTEMVANYFVNPSPQTVRHPSGVQISLAQPIAENAFGKSTRLLDQTVDIQNQTARHQIVEAYEDYLAFVINAYLEWYEDYANLEIGRASYQENLKLLENIESRKKSRIALPIDVNKISLQVISKKENMVELDEKYKRSRNTIERIMRHDGSAELIPQEPKPYSSLDGAFVSNFKLFQDESRTFKILKLLEEKSHLDVKRSADALLPSINLLVTFERDAEEYRLKRGEDVFSAGISVDWPIPDRVDRAEKKVNEISVKRQKLETENTYYRLYVSLSDLFLALQRQDELIAIAKEKIELSKSVLGAETENYSFGRVTLNDYIQAVNGYDANRFNLIFHQTLKNKLLLEWKRITDTLISRNEIEDFQ